MPASRHPPTGSGQDAGPRRALNWPAQWPYAVDARPVSAAEAMVASTDRIASQVGVELLREGGNAVDAAIAVAFALAVVNPEAGNLGGSGFLLVRTADGSASALDFRSKAPLAARRDMFPVPQTGQIDPALHGHLAVAVPGSVRGLWEAHRRFGRARWDRLVEPAALLARGFEVRKRFLRSFDAEAVGGLRRFPSSAAIFFPGGRLPAVGEWFHQPELARTLERIRDEGADGFYGGETADLIVAEMERGGGIVTHRDLARYDAVWREPLRIPYGDHTVLSMPPPSSGGVTLAAIVRILEHFDLGTLPWNGVGHIHLLAEAWRRAYADRNRYLADPDFVMLPTETLLSREYGAWRGSGIRRDRAGSSTEVGPGVEPFRAGGHTTHLSVVDGEGAAVSLTTTLNTWYGSKLVATGTGVLLNNDMDDFTARPGVPNYFGLVQGEANVIEPGKRMLSAMTPTIVVRGDAGGSNPTPHEELFLVIGTPGGATIITTVFQILSNLVDHRLGLAQAVLAPRVHHQHLPDQIWHEPGGLSPDVVEGLEALGHRVVERNEMSGDVQAILVRPDGTLEGQADPRRGGEAVGL